MIEAGSVASAEPASARPFAHLPAFLAIPFGEWHEERHPVLKLHRLCDAVEVLVRFCVAIRVGDLRRSANGRLPDEAARVVGRDIERPTLGGWREILDHLTAAPAEAGAVFPEMREFVRGFLAGCFPAQPTTDRSLLALRNTLAHGGGMTVAEAERLLTGDRAGGGWVSRVTAVLEPLAFLRQVRVGVGVNGQLREVTPDGRTGGVLPAPPPSSIGPRLVLERNGRWLELAPLCDFGHSVLPTSGGNLTAGEPCPLVYFRANLTSLSYVAYGGEYPFSETDARLAEFRDLFRLDAAPTRNASEPNDYLGEMRRDSDAVVGRVDELRVLKEALRATDRGVLWVPGEAGVGKSYLLSKLARDLEGHGVRGRCVYWRFRAADVTRCNRTAFLRHAVAHLAEWGPLERYRLRPATDPDRLREQLDTLLAGVRGTPPDGQPDRRVYFVVDGLDEIGRLDPDFAGVPFTCDLPGVVWVCAGRPEAHLSGLFTPERCRLPFGGLLPPMGAADIRGLLIDSSGCLKYGLLARDREDGAAVVNPLVEAVVERSAGLPLYVHFVIQDVLAGTLTYDDAHFGRKLPRSLAAYFDKALNDLRVSSLQQLITPLVATVVWAKEPLDEAGLFALLQRRYVVDSREALRDGLRAIRAVVRPVPLSHDAVGYEAYHLSFRDHFRADAAGALREANATARRAMADAVAGWSEQPAGSSFRQYLLHHGPAHLFEEGRYAEVFALARSGEFLAAQAAELRDEPNAPLDTLETAVRSGVAAGDMAVAAEFLLRRHFRSAEAVAESPLEALRTVGRRRAHGLVERRDQKWAPLWTVLLAWELADTGREVEARELLAPLGSGNDRLPDGVGTLLGHLPAPDPAELYTLLGGRLSDEEFDSWAKTLRATGIVAGEVRLRRARRDAGGEPPEDDQPTDTVEPAGEPNELNAVMAAIERDDFDTAHELIDRLENTFDRVLCWYCIAAKHHSAGDTTAVDELVGWIRIAADFLKNPVERADAIAHTARFADGRKAVRRVCREAVAVADAVDDPKQKVAVLTAVAETLAKADLADDALDLAARADDADVCLGVARILARHREWVNAGAAVRLGLATKEAHDAEWGQRAVTLFHLCLLLAKAGEFAAAGAAVAVIGDDDVRDQCRVALAHELIDAGRFREGNAQLARITGSRARVTAYAGIAIRRIARGDEVGGRSACERACEELGDDPEPGDALVAAMLALAHVRLGEPSAAEGYERFAAEHADQQQDPHVRSACYAALAVAADADRPDTAAVYRLSARAVSTDRTGVPRVVLLSQLAEVQFIFGDDEGAIRDTLHDARAAAPTDDWLPWCVALAVAAGSAAMTGQLELAHDWIARSREYRARAVEAGHTRSQLDELDRSLAAALAFAGDPEAGHELYREDSSSLTGALTLGAVAFGRSKAGDAEGARDAARNAVRVFLDGPCNDVVSYFSEFMPVLTYALAADGEGDAAVFLWEEWVAWGCWQDEDPLRLTDAMAQCEKPHDRAAGLIALAEAGLRIDRPESTFAAVEALLACDDLTAARRALAVEIPDERFGPSHYRRWAELHERAGDDEGARRALLQAVPADAEELVRVAAHFDRLHMPDAARETRELALQSDPWVVIAWAAADGQGERARELASDALLNRENPPPDRLNMLSIFDTRTMNALATAGDLEAALRILLQTWLFWPRDYKRDLFTLTDRLKCCSDAPEVIRRVLRNEDEPAAGGPPRAALLYGLLAWAGDLPAALTGAATLAPDEGRTLAYDILLPSPAVAEGTETARLVIEQARLAADAEEDARQKAQLLHTLATTCLRLGHTATGTEFLERLVQLDDADPDWCSVTGRVTAAGEFRQHGFHERATGLIREATERLEQSYPWARVHGYAQIGRYLAEREDPDAPAMFASSLRTAESFITHFSKGNTRLVLEAEFSAVRGTNIAEPLRELIEHQKKTLLALGGLQITHGDLTGAAATAGILSDPAYRSGLESDTVAAHALRGEWDEAWRLSELVRDPVTRCRTFCTLALSCADAGKYERVEAALAAATAAHAEVPNYGYEDPGRGYTEGVTLSSLVVTHLRLGDLSRADEWLATVPELVDERRNWFLDHVLELVVKALIPRDPARAVEYAQRIHSDSQRERALEALTPRAAAERPKATLPPETIRHLLQQAEQSTDPTEFEQAFDRIAAVAEDEPTLRACLAVARSRGFSADRLPRDWPERIVRAECPAVAAEYVVLGGRLGGWWGSVVPAVVEQLTRRAEVGPLTTILFTGLTDLKDVFDACLGLARGRPDQAARIARVVADADRLFFGG